MKTSSQGGLFLLTLDEVHYEIKFSVYFNEDTHIFLLVECWRT